MKQILICDNNPIFAQYLAQEVEKLMPSTHEISICHSAEELRSAVVSYPPDIVLLDIHLGDTPENGIALAQELFPHSSATSVIFITGYIEYVSEVYETDHVYFLQKPIDTNYLKRALEKAMEEETGKAPVFSVQIRGMTQLIDLREVLCVESFYRKLRFRLWNETIECYGSFSSLPGIVRERTIHCHKSFLVNPDYIRTMDHQKFLLKDGSSVPISRARFSESRQSFLDYCARHLTQ